MPYLFKLRILEMLPLKHCLLPYFLACRQLLLREMDVVGQMVSLGFETFDSLQLRLKWVILGL